MEPSPGVVVADRFRLERRLGQGGMGSVWLAQHLALRTPCAIKFMHAEAAAQASIRARFEREAVAAAQLRSPNVVQILDHGVWEEAPYIAMELLDGEDLQQRLARVRVLPPKDVLRIVSEAARALTKAHAVGLVHRDLKPANIFLVRDDDREVVKVLDFGVAKLNSGNEVDAQTKTGSLLGTPFYMSPEQAQGAKDLDHRSDLWALGVIAFQCLTGVLPFSDTALGALFMRIIVHPLPLPSQVAAVPQGFDAWWLRAASRDPGARFQTARELSDALTVALGCSLGGEASTVAASASSAADAAPAAAPFPEPPPWTPLPRQTPWPASRALASGAVAGSQMPAASTLGPAAGLAASVATAPPGETRRPASGRVALLLTAVGVVVLTGAGVFVARSLLAGSIVRPAPAPAASAPPDATASPPVAAPAPPPGSVRPPTTATRTTATASADVAPASASAATGRPSAERPPKPGAPPTSPPPRSHTID